MKSRNKDVAVFCMNVYVRLAILF